MTVNIENKIEIWQNKLLDLGKRNKLLNYRETKRSTLRIITPEIYSYKTNKKAVLEQLEVVLNLAKNKAQLSDDAYLKLDTLERDREKLNQYAAQLDCLLVAMIGGHCELL